MKKVFILIAAFALISSASLFAVAPANTEIKAEANAAVVVDVTTSGKVFDKETKESLAGASVFVNGEKIYTDLDGNFKLPAGVEGECEIKVSMISYQDVVLKVNLNQKDALKVALNQR